MPNFNFLPQKFDFITVNHDKLSMKAKVGVANLVVSTVYGDSVTREFPTDGDGTLRRHLQETDEPN